MHINHLQYLSCPECGSNFNVEIFSKENNIINQGRLICTACNIEYEIEKGIPRFVPKVNYSDNFGFQWNKHSRTQYDDNFNKPISETRFNEETKWKNDLAGEIIIEAGSGSGRFTELAVKTKAMVLSFDYSSAVDANYKSNKDNANLLLVQADIYKMPFKDSLADKIFCIGVIQHTPNPELTFKALSEKIKIGGKIVVDVYKLGFINTFLSPKYVVRLLTKNINNEKLYKICKSYVNLMWTIIKLNNKLFGIKWGKALNWRLLVPDYSYLKLDDKVLKEWAYLDLFDMLSPKYDKPQTIKTLKKWFNKYKFKDIDVCYGYNGIEGRGTKI